MAQHRGGLRVVDEDEVGVLKDRLQRARVLLVDILVEVEEARREVDRIALKGVVEALRDVEEIGVPLNDLPHGLQSEVFHQGNQPHQDLGHTSAEARRVDVDDGLALQGLGQLLELLDDLASGRLRVFCESRRHRAALPLPCSSKQAAIRSRSSVSDHMV